MLGYSFALFLVYVSCYPIKRFVAGDLPAANKDNVKLRSV